ncbi:MAG: deoxyguanosinetriphosphate triphosphohydrolase [Actinomycetota bacterium]|nr:deoxyguanosinetriphosphate triphosphohydrolase [Actinomycetota bacterium]
MDVPASTPGYTARDAARLLDEPAKRGGRTPYERDRARVLHAASFRRLSAKTQVVGPGTDDFVRNRLTHSLEVAQVARDLGKALGCDGDVVETAALAHDLGHPPFGHNGERALNDAALAIGGFEGNAQTLRVLTRLEAKTFDHSTPPPRSLGLNLTRAVLDACAKYPWTLDDAPQVPIGNNDDPSWRVRKFGVYADDLPVFWWLRDGAPSAARCLEAQVMDLADDIAYSVHDVEDAVVAGRLQFDAVSAELAGVWTAVRDWYLPQADDAVLESALKRLAVLPEWPDRAYDGTRIALARLKGLTSALIGRFCSATEAATRARHGAGRLTRYAADLVVPEDTWTEIAVLKGIAAHFVMRSDERRELLLRQRAVLGELVGALAAAGPDALEPTFRQDHTQAVDEAARLRVVIDQVASLTDPSARAWHARLCGR